MPNVAIPSTSWENASTDPAYDDVEDQTSATSIFYEEIKAAFDDVPGVDVSAPVKNEMTGMWYLCLYVSKGMVPFPISHRNGEEFRVDDIEGVVFNELRHAVTAALLL